MIIGPNKGVFFVATALMCSAALYAAELSSPNQDPLRRVFIGVPNQLTVPPDFPVATETTTVSTATDVCDPLEKHPAPGCVAIGASTEKPTPAAVVLPAPAIDVISEGKERAVPTSLSTSVQAH